MFTQAAAHKDQDKFLWLDCSRHSGIHCLSRNRAMTPPPPPPSSLSNWAISRIFCECVSAFYTFYLYMHCKKSLFNFSVPVIDIPAGDGEIYYLFLQCGVKLVYCIFLAHNAVCIRAFCTWCKWTVLWIRTAVQFGTLRLVGSWITFPGPHPTPDPNQNRSGPCCEHNPPRPPSFHCLIHTEPDNDKYLGSFSVNWPSLWSLLPWGGVILWWGRRNLIVMNQLRQLEGPLS